MTTSEDSFESVSSLLDDATELTYQTQAVYEVDHEYRKLSYIHDISQFIFSEYSTDKHGNMKENELNALDIDQLHYSIQDKDYAISLLREERDDYLTELNDLHTSLHILSIDRNHLECEIKRRKELEEKKNELENTLQEKETILQSLQQSNLQLQNKKKEFMIGLMEALQEDGVVVVEKNDSSSSNSNGEM